MNVNVEKKYCSACTEMFSSRSFNAQSRRGMVFTAFTPAGTSERTKIVMPIAAVRLLSAYALRAEKASHSRK